MAKKAAGDKPKRSYSWTTIDLYENRCPFAMHLAKDIKQETHRSNPWRDRGKVAHEIMAAYNGALCERCVAQDLNLLRTVASDVLHTLPEAKLISHAAIREMCETAAIAQGDLDFLHVTGVEEFFTIKLGRFVFRGKKDLEIDNGTTSIIRDYKTGYQLPTREQVDQNPQLRIYAWAKLNKNPAIESVLPELLFMPLGVTLRPESAPWTREDLADVKDDLLAAMEAIEADDTYEPHEGDHCELCEFTDYCPKIIAMRDSNDPRLDSMILSDEDAVRVAGEIILLDQRKKNRRDALKLWSTRTGGVQVDSKVFSFKTVTRREFDTRKVAVAVKQLGHDPFEVLRVDSDSLDKLTARVGTPDFVKQVHEATTNRPHSDFRARKAEKKGGAE